MCSGRRRAGGASDWARPLLSSGGCATSAESGTVVRFVWTGLTSACARVSRCHTRLRRCPLSDGHQPQDREHLFARMFIYSGPGRLFGGAPFASERGREFGAIWRPGRARLAEGRKGAGHRRTGAKSVGRARAASGHARSQQSGSRKLVCSARRGNNCNIIASTERLGVRIAPSQRASPLTGARVHQIVIRLWPWPCLFSHASSPPPASLFAHPTCLAWEAADVLQIRPSLV